MPVLSQQRCWDAQASTSLHEPLLSDNTPSSLPAFHSNENPAGQTIVADREALSHQNQAGGRCWNSFLIRPESGGYACWSGIMILAAYITAFQVPITIAFQEEFALLTAMMDTLFMLDVLSKFFIPKYRHGTVIVKPSEIAWTYARGGFWVDVVSAYPMDSLLVWWYGKPAGIFKVLSLLRLLRLRWAARLIRDMEENIEFDYYAAVVFKLLSILLLVAHFQACGFWYLAYLNDFNDTTWVTHFGELQEGQTAWDHYLSSLYWTYTTISTTGYGDLTPMNDDERFYTLCAMILNIGLTAYIVGNTTMLATKADSCVLEYRATVTEVKQYMQRKNIDPELMDATLKHLKLNQDMQGERDDILKHCAPFMRTRILSFLYKTKLRDCILLQVRLLWHSNAQMLLLLFTTASILLQLVLDPLTMLLCVCTLEGVSESFIDSVSQTAHLEFVHCQSCILQAGERAPHLYFVLSGTVAVYNPDGHFLMRQSDGAMFGEETVLCDLSVACSYWSETLVKMLVVPIAAIQDACKRSKMDHRICCFNFQRILMKLDPTEEPDLETRISKVIAFVTAMKTDLVTKLCYACSRGDVRQLKYLLQSDPQHDINMGDYDGRRPLHVAAANGRLEALQYLIVEKDADVNVKDIMGGTPLHDAVKSLNSDAAALLKMHGAELHLEDTGSVLCNAVYRGKADLLKMYLEHGADPCVGDYDRRTALHIACAEGLLPLVKILMHYGADENLRDRWNVSPFDEARRNSSKHAVLLYLDSVAKQKKSGQVLMRVDSLTPA